MERNKIALSPFHSSRKDFKRENIIISQFFNIFLFSLYLPLCFCLFVDKKEET